MGKRAAILAEHSSARTAILLSIIIPTGGDCSRLGWTLAGLSQQTGITPGNIELIVIGGGLDKETGGAVKQLLTDWREYLPVAKVRYEGLAKGKTDYRPAQARNRGIALAQGARCVFLNEDCIPDPDWLAAHAGAKEAAYGLRRRLPLRAVQAYGEAVPGIRPVNERLGMYVDGFDIRAQEPESLAHSWLACSASAPTNVLRELGGFDSDTNSTIVYADVDLAARMKRHGVTFERLTVWVTHLDHPRREGLLSGDKFYQNIFAQEDRVALESGSIAEDTGAGEEIALPLVEEVTAADDAQTEAEGDQSNAG